PVRRSLPPCRGALPTRGASAARARAEPPSGMSRGVSDEVPVLEVEHLRKTFRARKGIGRPRQPIAAVDDVSFTVRRGRTTALVGESGCGKSTLARLILHLHRADSGRIVLLGNEVQHLTEREFRPFRRHVQMIFQNPLASFDPMYSTGS